MSKSELFSIKPVFVTRLVFLRILPFVLFMSAWGAGFIGGILTGVLKFTGWLPFAIGGFFCGGVLPVLSVFLLRGTYAKTKYTFYDNRIEYFEGFLNIQKKSIRLDCIQEVNLSTSVFQKPFNLGTVTLTTNTTTGNGIRSGINLRDIENADEFYEKIRLLIEKKDAA